MNNFCSIQIFLKDEWIDCATVELRQSTTKGWCADTGTYYAFDYAIPYMDLRDGHALSNYYPVNVESNLEKHWPAFLMDLLPQGYGRRELLKKLGYSENAQESADWALLKSGASNSIGNLRVKEAHEWLIDEYAHQPLKGFRLEEIIQRNENFIESLSSFGLFIAGSSGVQGEWPKLLLTEGYDGLYYLDHTLADEHAKRHWLVKFSRGSDERLNKILIQEPLYMQLATYLGLRTYQNLEQHGRSLFIPRFDRRVINGKVERIAQESLASFAGKPGFGVKMTHNEACLLIEKYCSQPKREILEYLKRDLANIALGNKDNHTRNTAFQRFNNGHIQLSPLFDFAPMWLHPDGIARCTKWEKEEGNLSAIVKFLVENTVLTSEDIYVELKEQFELYLGLQQEMNRIGIDPEVVTYCQYKIHNICEQLRDFCYG